MNDWLQRTVADDQAYIVTEQANLMIVVLIPNKK